MTLRSLFQSLRKGNALRPVDVMGVSECFETVIQTPYYPTSGLKLRHMWSPFPAAGARVAGSLSAPIETIFMVLAQSDQSVPFLQAYHHSNL